MIITESNSNLLNLIRKQFGFAQINTIPDTQNNSVVEKPIINNIVENIAQTYQDNSICFKYLENDDLSLTSYERDYLKQYNIHLCCYIVDQTCRLPFVKFLLSVQNDTYVFPNTPLQMQEIYSLKENLILSETKTDEFSEVDNEFLYQVGELFQKSFGTSYEPSSYKGFLEKDTDIFVFFDISELTTAVTRPYTMCIMDQIINSMAIKGKPIDHNIIHIFQSHTFLHTLRTCENIHIQYPKIGYIITTTETTKENLYMETDQSSKGSKLITPPASDYNNKIGYYLFSGTPLQLDNIENIRNFACFVENFDEIDDSDNEKTFTFEENNTVFYGIPDIDMFSELI